MAPLPSPSAPNRQPPKIENAPLDPAAWKPLLDRYLSQNDPIAPKSLETVIAGLEAYQSMRSSAKQKGVKPPEFSKNAENAFLRLSRGVNNYVIFKELGLYYMRDLEMSQIAVAHFERAIRLGGEEKDLAPLIDVATVTAQRQSRDQGGSSSLATTMGITEGQRRRPDIQQIMSTTGKIVIRPTAAQLPSPEPEEEIEEDSSYEEGLGSPEDYVDRAKEFIAEKRLSQAADLLRKATNSENNMSRSEMWQIWTSLGQAFFLEGDYVGSEEAYSHACTFRSDFMSSHFNLALALQMNGKYLEAVTSYNQADMLEGNNAKVWCNLGAVYFQMSEYKRAELALRKTIQIKPDYGRAWDNLAASLGAMGQSKEAALAVREAIKYRQDKPETWFKFGALSYGEGMYSEALEAFNRSRKDSVLGAQSLAYMSLCYSAVERPQEAEEAIHQILALDPNCPLLWMAWNNLGLSLYDAGNHEKAVVAYTAAAAIQANESEVWFNLGLAHNTLGRPDQAHSCYVKALEINPNDSAAWHNLGVLFSETGQYPEAVDSFEKELTIQPDSLRGWYFMALALEKEGREEDARMAFDKASELQALAQEQASGAMPPSS